MNIILWASQTTLSARSMPASKCRCRVAERQRAAVGRIDVQPHFVPLANIGDSVSGSNAPIGVAHAAAETATIGHAARPQAFQRVVEPIGIHAPRSSSAASTI